MSSSDVMDMASNGLTGVFISLRPRLFFITPSSSSIRGRNSCPHHRYGNQQAQSVRSIAMAASDKLVASIIVYVTVPNREAGKKLAQSIVKEKLAACVNIIPGIESIYQWQGELNA